jgi:hypothetical protein
MSKRPEPASAAEPPTTRASTTAITSDVAIRLTIALATLQGRSTRARPPLLQPTPRERPPPRADPARARWRRCSPLRQPRGRGDAARADPSRRSTRRHPPQVQGGGMKRIAKRPRIRIASDARISRKAAVSSRGGGGQSRPCKRRRGFLRADRAGGELCIGLHPSHLRLEDVTRPEAHRTMGSR